MSKQQRASLSFILYNGASSTCRRRARVGGGGGGGRTLCCCGGSSLDEHLGHHHLERIGVPGVGRARQVAVDLEEAAAVLVHGAVDLREAPLGEPIQREPGLVFRGARGKEFRIRGERRHRRVGKSRVGVERVFRVGVRKLAEAKVVGQVVVVGREEGVVQGPVEHHPGRGVLLDQRPRPQPDAGKAILKFDIKYPNK